MRSCVRLNWYRPRPPSRARAHANANAGPGGAAERTPAPQDKGPVGALMEMGLGDRGMVTAALKVARNPLRNHYNGARGLLAGMDYRFPEAK